MQALFNAIRSAASAANWSRGVELARERLVAGQSEQAGEITLRVTPRGDLVALSVVLYSDDEEWECSCSGVDDPCEHVTAAVIALRQARKEGNALPETRRAMGHLRYLFARGPGGLGLQREIVVGDETRPLTKSLKALASDTQTGHGFAASPADLDVERLVTRRGGALPPGLIPRLLAALEGCGDIRLDDEPIRVSREALRPQLILRDVAEGFLLKLEPDPTLEEVFANSVARCGDTLRPLGPSGLDGRELAELPRGRVYPFEAAASLVTEVLPSLQKRIGVEVVSKRLPDSSSEPPRIVIEVTRVREQLSVLSTLVYGDPAAARIDAGKLVHLRGAIPIRDEEAEARLRRNLRSELGLAPGYRIELSAGDAIQFSQRLQDWGGELHGDAHLEFFRAATLEPDLQIREDGGFHVGFQVPGSEGTEASGGAAQRGEVSAVQVLRAWRDGESLVPLQGGGFAPLPSDWLERFGHRVTDLLQARGSRDLLPACALPDLAQLCDDLDHPPPPMLERLRPLIADFDGIPSSELPSDLTAQLRDYQRHGVDWLCFLRDAGLGALLADDMGLGKTVQALCALRGRTLVVAPTSVLHGWADEMRRFRPQLSFCLYHGARRELDQDAEVVLTSYALLRLDIATLSTISWDCVVLDEAQNIKNPDSQVARAAYELRAEFRMALSGTPVENRLEELWSQLHFLNPGLLGGRGDFAERYARPIGEGDAAIGQALRDRIRPFVLRRLKREVARELPARTELVLRCELSEQEREVYDAIRAASLPDVVRQLREGGGVMAALEALLRLRQASCHSGLIPGQEAVATSSKLSLLIERLEQAFEDGHKALVFSQWTSLLDRIEPLLGDAQIEYSRLDGSTRDRGRVVHEFQADDGPPVMLVSLRAGGTGLNLTAADHVFLLDPWWNPAVEDQAADRAHRIGQQRPVVIHRVIARETVEERILLLQQSKRALAQAALGSGDHAAQLGRDDLLALLE